MKCLYCTKWAQVNFNSYELCEKRAARMQHEDHAANERQSGTSYLTSALRLYEKALQHATEDCPYLEGMADWELPQPFIGVAMRNEGERGAWRKARGVLAGYGDEPAEVTIRRNRDAT